MCRGSLAPLSIGQQVPERPTRLHATHAPLHATLQHTPSVQKPDAHSWFFAQTAPFRFGPQLPATHFVPAQSESDAHVATQAFLLASHPYGAHSVSGATLQRPLPSHTLPPLTVAPEQVPARHTVPAACCRQAPAPLQVPSSPQVDASVFGHSPALAGTSPRATNEHVPIEGASAHDLQVSLQATLQQTPSAQKPLAHSPAQPHD